MPAKLIGLTLAACLFVAMPQLASAQSYGLCTDPKTTEEATTCLADAASTADNRLDQRRNRIRKLLESETALLAGFNASEARWDDYRKAMCSGFVNDFYDGGTIRVPSILACQYDLTEAHHDFLGRIFSVQLKPR